MVRSIRFSIRGAMRCACLAIVFWNGAIVGAMAQGVPTVRHVGTSSDCTYATIQAAINAALPGDIIRIQGGHVYDDRQQVVGHRHGAVHADRGAAL
jgi:hypothetical protein